MLKITAQIKMGLTPLVTHAGPILQCNQGGGGEYSQVISLFN